MCILFKSHIYTYKRLVPPDLVLPPTLWISGPVAAFDSTGIKSNGDELAFMPVLAVVAAIWQNQIIQIHVPYSMQ